MRNTETEHRLRLVAVGWYLLGWIPCLALNGVGVPSKICLALYAAFGMAVYMVGMSIARERADALEGTVEIGEADGRALDAAERERIREIERDYNEGR